MGFQRFRLKVQLLGKVHTESFCDVQDSLSTDECLSSDRLTVCRASLYLPHHLAAANWVFRCAAFNVTTAATAKLAMALWVLRYIVSRDISCKLCVVEVGLEVENKASITWQALWAFATEMQATV